RLSESGRKRCGSTIRQLCGNLSQSCQNLIGRDNDPAAVLEFHENLAGQDLLRKDAALTFARENPSTHRRQLLLKLFIDILLEAQATFQSAATTGDFRWIERRLLQFGHAH